MLFLNHSDIAIIIVKNADFFCIIHDISKSDKIQLLKDHVLDPYGYVQMHAEVIVKNKLYKLLFWQFSQTKKPKTKNVLIDEKMR